ncbi:hypothetical protein [Apilactobacillus timberlakei]|uniref:hypothetical protein n=1 Tax=Apilactobacillus timberlakei TaxID=2008380 RepID=UPI001125C53F|nr:hypothetical protein [Apilactobacillus timberlakei]TPR16746.1 hypothetical protein DYZ95_07130 [Apilactobacillus timberlakei]
MNKSNKKINEKDTHKNSENSDSYGADNNNLSPFEIVRKLQLKFIPYQKKFRALSFKAKDNVRFQRFTVTFIFLFLTIGSLISARIFHKGYIVENTPIGVSRSFLNGDKATINNTTYDKNNDMAIFNISTDSSSGLIDGKDLEARFVIMNKPSKPVKAPNLTLIPTYSNHFTILVKGLYKDFGALKLTLKNNRTSGIADYAKGLKEGSNEQTDTPISSKDAKVVMNYDKDDKDSTSGTGIQDNVKTNSGKNFQKASKLMPTLKDSNTTKFIVTEKAITKHEKDIDENISPQGIMRNDLSTTISNLEDDIKTQKKIIDSNNDSITSIKKQIQDIKKDKLNLKDNSKSQSLENQISNIKDDNLSKNNRIKNDKKLISKYNNQIKLIEKDEIQFNKPQKSQNASLFHP